MEWLQTIDLSQLPLPIIAVGCALLCGALMAVAFVLQAVSGVFDVILGLVEVASEIARGGPVAWCGCALLIGVLLAGAGFAFLLLHAPESCAANPTRFCQWFGFLP